MTSPFSILFVQINFGTIPSADNTARNGEELRFRNSFLLSFFAKKASPVAPPAGVISQSCPNEKSTLCSPSFISTEKIPEFVITLFNKKRQLLKNIRLQ